MKNNPPKRTSKDKKPRKKYEPPKLIRYGTLSEITKKHAGAGDAKAGSSVVG